MPLPVEGADLTLPAASSSGFFYKGLCMWCGEIADIIFPLL